MRGATRIYGLTEADTHHLPRLAPHHREILGAEGTYQEIAERFGIALGTVRSRLNRARKALAALHKAEADRA